MTTYLIEAVSVFNNHASELIQLILENPTEYQRLIRNQYDLLDAVRTLPNHAELLMQPILQDVSEYNRLIYDLNGLIELTEAVPNCAEAVVQIILNDPQAFRNLIKTQDDLRQAAKAFPKHIDVFGKSTIEEAAHMALITSQAAKKYTIGATIGALANGEFSYILPQELSHYIGNFFLNRKDAAKLAKTCNDSAELARTEEFNEKPKNFKN